MPEFLTVPGTMTWMASLVVACGVFSLVSRPSPMFQLMGMQLILGGAALTLHVLGPPLSYSALLLPAIGIGVGLVGLGHIRREGRQ